MSLAARRLEPGPAAPPAAAPAQRRMALFADALPARPIAGRPTLKNLSWAGLQLAAAVAIVVDVGLAIRAVWS